MKISVIVPFHDRLDALSETIAAIQRQTLNTDLFELILVCDGFPKSLDLISETNWPFTLKVLQQENRGPSAARNLGTRHARNELLLFLDADIIASPNLLEVHRDIHLNNPNFLVAGAVLPWKNIRNYSFTDEVIDWHIGDTRTVYSELKKEKIVRMPFYDTITQNLSLRRSCFEEIGEFEERIRGCEDVEFGYRAMRAGYPIVYAPHAISYHNHSRTIEEICHRHRYYSRFRPLIIERYPEISDLIPSWRIIQSINWRQDSLKLIYRKVMRQIIALPPVYSLLRRSAILLENKRRLPHVYRFLYWRLIAVCEYLGFRDGIQRFQG